MTIELQSTITCPECGHASVETMPTDACRYIYVCKQCRARLKPKTGDCCVYCSYGSVSCLQSRWSEWSQVPTRRAIQAIHLENRPGRSELGGSPSGSREGSP